MTKLLPELANNHDEHKNYIIYYQSSSAPTMSPEDVLGLTNDINCHVGICNSWDELLRSLSMVSNIIHNSILLLVDSSTFKESPSTIGETITMISTFSRFVNRKEKMKFGVVVDNPCTYSFIKDLQNTDVLGIVPCSRKFGYEVMRESVVALINGHSFWPKEVIELCVIPKPKDHNGIRLTPRQQQVTDLICNRGLSNKKIANILKISESTVKIHISAILKEYGVRNRTQLALAARSSLTA